MTDLASSMLILVRMETDLPMRGMPSLMALVLSSGRSCWNRLQTHIIIVFVGDSCELLPGEVLRVIWKLILHYHLCHDLSITLSLFFKFPFFYIHFSSYTFLKFI